MSLVFSFTPESMRPEIRAREWIASEFTPKKRPGAGAWKAPEHSKLTSDMKRDFIRDDWGNKVSEERFLIVDQRPKILVPDRPTYPGL